MTQIERATAATGNSQALMVWVNRSLEALWLLTIVLVPLAFLGRSFGEWSSIIGSYELPKIAILRTFAGLIAILWLIELALRSEVQNGAGIKSFVQGAQPTLWPRKLVRWLSSEPARWLIFAVILYLGSTLLSTALSTSVRSSLWGDAPGQDSYSAYTVVSYGLLFAVIATHLKTEAQLWRLVGAIVLMGFLVSGYAVLQHYGLDFLDLIEPFGHTRSTSTFGRTIFAGAVLVMSIPVTTMAGARSLTGKTTVTGFALSSSAWAIVLGVQILGTVFIASRGPWVGTLAGLAALLLLLAVFGAWRQLIRAALVLALGTALALAVFVSPLQSVADTAAEEQIQTLSQGDFQSLGAKETSQRLASIGNQVASGNISGRKQIWGNAWELMIERPWFGFDHLSMSFLRPLIGYGPEQFRATYLLVSPPNPAANLFPNELAHAHNFFLHQGVETGFLGLFASAGLYLTVFGSGCYIWFRERKELSGVHKLVLAGLLATISGRFLEQMVGVARVSDLMGFWVLLAVFAALPVIFPTSRRSASDAGPAGQKSDLIGRASIHRSRSRSAPRSERPLRLRSLAKWLPVAGLVAGFALLTWTKNIDYVRSALTVDQAAAESRRGDFEAALSSVGQAIDLSPDVSTNYIRWSQVYWDHPSGDLVPRCGEPGDSPPHRLCLAQLSYDLNTQWLALRPNDFRARLALADSAMDLSLPDGDSSFQSQAVRLFQEAAAMVPNSWPLWNRVGYILIGLGQPDAALDAAANSLAITGNLSQLSAEGLRLQGIAYRLSGRHQDSLRSLDRAVLLNSQPGQALLERSRVYQEIGQADLAIEDLNEVVRLDPGSTEGFYRRGAAYYGIGRWEDAVSDLTRAIDLDPQHSEAFNNRGLAYARMSLPEAATRDFEQAIAIAPDFAIAHNNLGFTLRDLGQLERATDELDQAIRLDPTLTIAYYNRALAYTLLGRDSEAQRDGQLAIEMGVDAFNMNAAIDEFKARR